MSKSIMCKNIVTVDFDATEKTQYEKALFLARLKAICTTARCKIYKSKKGIHAYIYVQLGFWPRYAIRSYLLDDKMRLDIDEKRHINGWHRIEETLFNSKCQREYCYRESEISSFEELERILFNEL